MNIQPLVVVVFFVGGLVAHVIELSAAPTFTVTIDDPGDQYPSYHAGLMSHALAAASLWGSRIDSDADLSLVVHIDPAFTLGGGRSLTTGFVGNQVYSGNGNNYDVFNQGLAHEIITGNDPNGEDYDAEISLGPDYLVNNLWFDPDPNARTAEVPNDCTDAMSVFLHELAHAFAFNGWRGAYDGQITTGYLSTYDMLIERDSGTGDLSFTGSRAEDYYGGRVPVTTQGPNTYHHLGNNAPKPGSELIPDLMNGVVFTFGTRYYISGLDLAVLADVGIPIIPTPLAGDVNIDGVVNIFDINLVSAHWNETGPTGDANGDRIVNIFDVNLISSHWTPTGGTATAVSEPSALVLNLMGLVGLIAFGWRRRR